MPTYYEVVLRTGLEGCSRALAPCICRGVRLARANSAGDSGDALAATVQTYICAYMYIYAYIHFDDDDDYD